MARSEDSWVGSVSDGVEEGFKCKGAWLGLDLRIVVVGGGMWDTKCTRGTGVKGAWLGLDLRIDVVGGGKWDTECTRDTGVKGAWLGLDLRIVGWGV